MYINTDREPQAGDWVKVFDGYHQILDVTEDAIYGRSEKGWYSGFVKMDKPEFIGTQLPKDVTGNVLERGTVYVVSDLATGQYDSTVRFTQYGFAYISRDKEYKLLGDLSYPVGAHWGWYLAPWKFEKATRSEIEHFEACEKANKYVEPKNELYVGGVFEQENPPAQTPNNIDGNLQVPLEWVDFINETDYTVEQLKKKLSKRSIKQILFG